MEMGFNRLETQWTIVTLSQHFHGHQRLAADEMNKTSRREDFGR